MKSLSYWGIWIYVLADIIFNHYSMSESTNWSIFYFSATTLSAALVSADIYFFETEKAMKATGASFFLFFIVWIGIELFNVNVPFDEYIVNVNESKMRFINYGAMVIALLGIMINGWERTR
jgi:hypothetical protein